MLVARLGPCPIEVARLVLNDIDCDAARSSSEARGAGRAGSRCQPMSGLRPCLDACHVFLTCKAPHAPIRADLVGDVVERACRRAGSRTVGPHRLRHALAADMLRHGAGLTAIGQVLRHQDLATIARYAKVDFIASRAVAQPWPGTEAA
ncbi:tyrosine-type recombinase/integrase [Streptomyces sp. NPDC007929]